MKATDDQLLSMMLSGQSQADIARELNTSKQQVCRRVNTEEFQSLLSQYRRKILDSVYADLTANARKAVDVLVQLLDNPNPFVQYNSACKILNTLTDYSVAQDLFRDIEELKEIHRTEQQNP